MSFEIATEFDGTTPTAWKTMSVGDPHEALRVKILEILGSEGPKTTESLHQRLPFPKNPLIVLSTSWRHVTSSPLAFSHKPMMLN